MTSKLAITIEKTIHYFSYGIFVLIIGIFLYALINQDVSAEAPVGDFKTQNFNSGWDVSLNDTKLGKMELPNRVSGKKNDRIVMKNTLPANLNDGMNMMIRTSLQDAQIYINGELRESYASENFKDMTYYLPSAYIMIPLFAKDAGAEVEIQLTVKATSILNSIQIGYGNNSWFSILQKNFVIVSISIFIVIIGIIIIISFFVVKSRFSISRSILYLGFLMNIIGIWLLSESKLRQVIFPRASLCSIFSYISLEIIGVFALLYFDEIQHRIHHKIYLILECLISIQLTINIILNFTDILCFYQSLIFSHIWLLTGIIVIILNVISDYQKKHIENYKIASLGISLFAFFGIIEIYAFYFSNTYEFGPSISVGLIFLLIMNIIQIFSDTVNEFKRNEEKMQIACLNTVETIANSIDAKDEYTGGHSERVSKYAGLLAENIAKEYHFSQNDITRIRYISLLHDIGKIGITDDILNKSGKLTTEEYSLMKKHVDIGNVLMTQLGGNIDDLLNGIRHHHERYDGNGYPEGLHGKDIPLIARILCLADSFDAMTSSRIYRRRLTDEEAKNEILRCSGTQFDPDLAKAFVNLIETDVISTAEIEEEKNKNSRKFLRSLILEKSLENEKEQGNSKILNPSHVRLACYIMTLSEIHGKKFEVFFVKAREDHQSQESISDFLNQTVDELINNGDINIRYTESQNLVILFESPRSDINETINRLSDKLEITNLTFH